MPSSPSSSRSHSRTFNLATAIAREVVSALQQHSVDGEFGGALSFRIWQTDVYYGEALLFALTVILVVAALFGLWQLTKRTSRTCPECRSSVPATASVCRFLRLSSRHLPAMRDWLSSLTAERIPELALGLAVGYALVTLAGNIGQVVVSILAQHFGSDPAGQDTALDLLNFISAPFYLSFTVGGTIIVYGNVIAALLSLGAVTAVGRLVVRRRDRVLGACPFCASRIPYESTHCAYCGSSVTLGET